MVDKFTKVVLTVIAINLTLIVGYGLSRFSISESIAADVQNVRIVGGKLDEVAFVSMVLDVQQIRNHLGPQKVTICDINGNRCAAVGGIKVNNGELDSLVVVDAGRSN